MADRCYPSVADVASGTLDERPELANVRDQLRPGDTLVVWKLDRLGRSLRHLIDTITDLQQRDVGFRSLQEQIDTTTPGGKLIFHIFGALAEFERDLIRQRTLAGLAAARARGRGRSPDQYDADQTGARPPAVRLTGAFACRDRPNAGRQPGFDLPASGPNARRHKPSSTLTRSLRWPALDVRGIDRAHRLPALQASALSAGAD